MANPYRKLDCYGLALDPIHVGAGGYRIGRVDNTIVRDPATQLPKIPGTSIAGVCRAMSAMAIDANTNNVNEKKYLRSDGNSCAGKGGKDGSEHCAKSDCPICMTFGYSNKEKSFQGLAQFTDAMILFLPVHTAVGTLWMTSPACFEYANISYVVPDEIAQGKIIVSDGVNLGDNNRLNLGWIMFEATTGTIPTLPDVPWKAKIQNKIAVVSDAVFGNLVNSSLEVRTSVSIDPQTGAAESGALFTYEAIPRGTIMAFNVTITDPKFFNGVAVVKEHIASTIKDGFNLIEILGIGGMNTRGMGRMSIVTTGGES